MTVRMYANIGPDMERHHAEFVSVHSVTADDIGTRCGGLLRDEPTDPRVQTAQGQMVVPIRDLRLFLSDTTTARRLAEWLNAAADAIDAREET